MTTKQGPTLRAQWLGQQLREFRDRAGLTLNDAADYLQRHPGTVSRFESAEYPIRRPDLIVLLDLYRVSDTRHRSYLMSLAEEVWRTGWWEGYADSLYDQRFIDYVWLESRAREIQTFKVGIVPGLLQTPEYAAAIIREGEPDASAEQVARWVELRMARQSVLTNNNPPNLSVLLSEAVLRRVVGDPKITSAQLEHLAAGAQQPGIALRVLPFNAETHVGCENPFHLYGMAAPYPDVAYVESPAGAIYVESPETECFTRIYHRLSTAALDEGESIAMVRTAANDLR